MWCWFWLNSRSLCCFLSCCPVVSDSLRPLGLQHGRLPCPSPPPGTCSDPCPSSRWCHPTITLCCPLLLPLIFPSIRVFSKASVLPIRWPKYLASASVLPVNIQGWFPIRIDWFDLIAVQETLKSFLQHHSSKESVHQLSFLYGPTLTSIHDYWKNHSFD